jgi:multidrug efflux system membrane fusion protein
MDAPASVLSRSYRLACRFPYAGTIIAATLLVPGCGRDATSSSEIQPPVVRVSRPIIRDVTDYVYFTGRIEATESVDLQARVTGYLNSVNFVPGSEVKAGQQLFKIDPRPYQATLDSANGQVEVTKAQANLAAADLRRAQEISKTPGAISQADLDKYAAQEDAAKAEYEAAKANAESARLNLEFTSITSPIDGLIGRNYPAIGNLVRQDNTLMATVVSQDPMYAYFDVDEQTLLRVSRLVQEGRIPSKSNGAVIPVEMALADETNEFPHSGMIDFVSNRINQSTETLEVRGVFENPRLSTGPERMLKPGMFVRIRVPVGKPSSALIVPREAIGTDQDRKFLLVVDDKNVVEERDIELGPEQPDGLQVVTAVKMVRTDEGLRRAASSDPADMPRFDSLSANDQVIVGGLQRVRPGTVVKTREASGSSGSTPPGSSSPSEAGKSE